MDARIREDAAHFDALLNTVPFHLLLPAGAEAALQGQSRDIKNLLDPKQAMSTSQRLREYLKEQKTPSARASRGKKRAGKGGTREELQAKLHSRIDELREKRRREQSERDKATAATRAAARGASPRERGEKRPKSPAKGPPADLEFSNVGAGARKAELTVAEL